MSLRLVQERLRAAGFDPGPIDGAWGPRMEAALTAALAAATDTRAPDLTDPDRLSRHFSLAELTVSAAAARNGVSNVPPPDVLATLRRTAARMEEVRTLLGNRPIVVTSGYRSARVNVLVGGSKTSAHMTGHAVDFTCPAFGTSAQVAAHLAKNLKGFDQIIEEFGAWVHVGFGPGQRAQLLTARKVGGRTVMTQGIAS